MTTAYKHDDISDFLITRSQLAKRWGVGLSTICQWDMHNDNKMKIYRIGPSYRSAIRYKFSEVLEVENASKVRK